MLLIDARNGGFRQVDWAPTQSDDAKTVVNGFINEIVRDIALRCPFGLLETEVTLNTQAPIEPVDTTDTISIGQDSGFSDDPWTVQRDTLRSALDAADYWPNDRSYDGRELLVKLSDTRWARHRIRQVVYRSGDTREYLSLYEPLDIGSFSPDGAYDALAWYIYEPVMWMPGDCIEIKSVRIEGTNTGPALMPMPQLDAERLMLKARPEDAGVGEPKWWFRWGTHQMPAPRIAPTVALDAAAGVWAAAAEDPPGEFEYAYTRCWGRRSSPRAHPSPASATAIRREPLWESELSPPSSSITVTAAGNGVKITTPDVERMQGFGPSQQIIRYAHSGWFTRVYRRRLDTSVASGAAFVEEPSGFYLLTETADTADNKNEEFIFYDNGDLYPDFFTLAPSRGDYFGIGLYPRPGGTYPLTVRYIRTPIKLVDDYDTIPITVQFEPILQEFLAAKLYEMRGDAGNAAIRRTIAEAAIKNALSAQPAFDTPASVVRYRRHARGSRRGSGFPRH